MFGVFIFINEVEHILMAYAEQLAKEHNCIGTWLVSGMNRKEAHPFYEKIGL